MGQLHACVRGAIRATASEHAPWYVVPADNKWFTPLVVAAAIVEVVEELDLECPKVGAEKKRALAAARAELAGETSEDRLARPWNFSAFCCREELCHASSSRASSHGVSSNAEPGPRGSCCSPFEAVLHPIAKLRSVMGGRPAHVDDDLDPGRRRSVLGRYRTRAMAAKACATYREHTP